MCLKHIHDFLQTHSHPFICQFSSLPHVLLTALCMCKAISPAIQNPAVCSFKTCEVLFQCSSLFYEYMGTHTHLPQKSHSQLLNAMWIPLCRIWGLFSGNSSGSDVFCRRWDNDSFFHFCFSWLIWVQMALYFFLDLTLLGLLAHDLQPVVIDPA